MEEKLTEEILSLSAIHSIKTHFSSSHNSGKEVFLILLRFGMWSSFSGQTIYETWIYMLYNVSFTALPIIWYGIFDFQYLKSEFLNTPKYYKIGLRSKSYPSYFLDDCFGPKIFWRWISTGFAQAFILIFVLFYQLENTVANDGETSTLFASGSSCYAGVVFIANITIITQSYSHSFWNIFLVSGSSLFFFLVWGVESITIFFIELYGTFPITRTAAFIFALILVVAICFLYDMGHKYIFALFL
jgi:phospholipid-transporting ATPase